MSELDREFLYEFMATMLLLQIYDREAGRTVEHVRDRIRAEDAAFQLAMRLRGAVHEMRK